MFFLSAVNFDRLKLLQKSIVGISCLNNIYSNILCIDDPLAFSGCKNFI